MAASSLYGVSVQSAGPPPSVDFALHADNRARLVAALRGCPTPPPPGSVILLAGGVSTMRDSSDHEPLFRQESFFLWAFGVKEPDFFGTVDVDTGVATLFAPRLPPAYAVWYGSLTSPTQFAAQYGTGRGAYVDELASTLAGASTLYTLSGTNSDSGSVAPPATFPGIAGFTVNSTTLWDLACEARVFKSPGELALLKYVARVSSEAHLAVMQHAGAVYGGGAPAPGKPSALTEGQLESLFHHWCYYHGGCRFQSYTCICASGVNGSVLHYGHAGEPNARTLTPTDLCLFDMGGEYHGYGADITCSFPASGKFSDDQGLLYDATFAAWKGVLDGARPGVSWVSLHEVAYREMLAVLLRGGVLQGDLQEMMDANLGATFMPHGLGHFLGIDTHE